MEADKMLDVYIHDYLKKRKYGASARTFQAEAQLLTNRAAIDAPGGFLLEWWLVFWDIFIARFKTPLSSTTASYNVVQMINTLERKDVQAQQLNQMQQLIQQKQLQGYGTQLLRGTTNEAMTRHSLGTTNALTKRVYKSNPQVERIPISVANKQLTNPRNSDNIGQHLDANHSCISKPETFRDQHSRQTQHSFPGDNLRFYPPLADQDHQFPVTQLDQSLTNMMIPAVSHKAAESGSDHGVNSLLLKGWPLMPDHSIRSFTGHSASVMSLDFHPTKEDLICSCDNVSTIRYWNIKNGGCAGVSKVRATQVRFQPNLGKYLAAADADGVLLIDVETTQICRYPLKGHISIIRGICWSSSGEYLASLSEDMVKVWKIGSSGEQECMHERSVTGKRFRCCTFHPCYPSVLVVGSDQCLEFWHMAENKMMIVLEEPVNSLAASRPTGVVASATDNNLIRLWK